MTPSPPDLRQLRAFAAVAELQSYRRAAARLGVTPSAVSQSVRALEEALGQPLVQRTTRSVAPSAAGLQLLARLRPHLDGLEAAWQSAYEAVGEPAGLLRLNMPRSAAQLIMAPVMSAFLAAHPRIALELQTQDGFLDIVAVGCDAGIRFEESVPRDMVALPMGGPQRFVVVARRCWPLRTARLKTPGRCWAGPASASAFRTASSTTGSSPAAPSAWRWTCRAG